MLVSLSRLVPLMTLQNLQHTKNLQDTDQIDLKDRVAISGKRLNVRTHSRFWRRRLMDDQNHYKTSLKPAMWPIRNLIRPKNRMLWRVPMRMRLKTGMTWKSHMKKKNHFESRTQTILETRTTKNKCYLKHPMSCQSHQKSWWQRKSPKDLS